MSDNEFTTVIIISGSKSGLVKMLNAALERLMTVDEFVERVSGQ